MRVWMLQALNSFYVKFLLRISKWTLLILFCLLLFIGAGFKFAFPKAIDYIKNSSNTQVVGQGPNSEVMYKDKALPKDFNAELEAEPAMLIFENQVRSSVSDEPNPDGQAEDAPYFRKINVNPRDKAAMVKLASQFLSRWESFLPTTTKEEYYTSLSPLVVPDGLESVAARKDNIQNSNIAPGASVGSKWMTDGYAPSNNLEVRRFDGKTAYLTTLGEIKTAGPSMIYKDARFIRSYALIVVRTDAGWKVQRAVAQTRVQVDE